MANKTNDGRKTFRIRDLPNAEWYINYASGDRAADAAHCRSVGSETASEPEVSKGRVATGG